MTTGKPTYRSLSDEELMTLLARRDSKAFEELYERYSRLMYNYFLRMLWKDREKARDFTQDLFSKVVTRPESFDISKNFKTWFYSIAHNMCKNEYAKAEVRKNAHSELAYTTETTEAVGGGKQLDRDHFNAKLEEALNELDEIKKTTFVLRFRQEMSIQEISEVMKCSEGTVKSRIFYTLKQLNEKLKVFEGIAIWILWIMTR
jgi:RNA polymerase sigma-70 factor (ECF subfamily)